MKRKIFFIGKACLVVLFLFATLEIRLRVFNPSPFMARGGRIVIPANKEYVFVNKAVKCLDPIVYVRKNSLGFRGMEPPRNWASVYSIVVVGGSSAACDNITEGKTWVDLLAAQLSNAFHHIWINNGGFAGHSTVAHLLLLQDYVVKLKPDMVLFFAGINDFDVDGHRQFDDAIVRNKFQTNSVKDFLRSANRNVETLNFFSNMFQKYTGHKRLLSYEELDLSTAPRLDLTVEQKKAYLETYKVNQLAGFRDRIRALADTCVRNRIRPVFVTVPALFGNIVDDATGIDMSTLKVADGCNGSLMGALLDLNNAEIRALKNSDIDVIDLATRMPKSSTYFADFFHFTNAGAERVAEIVYPELGAIVDRQMKSKPERSCPWRIPDEAFIGRRLGRKAKSRAGK